MKTLAVIAEVRAGMGATCTAPMFFALGQGRPGIRAWIKALMAGSSLILLLVVLTSARRPRPLVGLIVSGALANERGMIKAFGCEIDRKQ